MLKSILLVLAGGLFIAGSAANTGPGARQTAQQAAPTAAATPASATAPAPAANTTPVMEETPAAVPDGGMALDTRNPVKPTAESQAKAKQLYSIDCSMCHNDNGNGKSDLATSMAMTMPDFTDPKSLADHPDGELFNQIRYGKDKMPPEAKARATDNEVWNLIIYVRNFSKSSGTASAK